MYISLEDSCTKDFSKWPGVYHPEIAKDVRADEADGDVAGDANTTGDGPGQGSVQGGKDVRAA